MRSYAKLISTILVILGFFTPQKTFAAISFATSGDVSFDKASISLEIDINGIDPADLKANGSTTDYKQNLRVFLKAVSIDTPLRTAVGSNKLTDYVNDYYWDLSNASVNIVSQTTNEISLKYKIKIYENKSFLNYDSIESLLDTSTPELLGVEIGFWALKSDGSYEKRSQSSTNSISVNYAAVSNAINLTSITAINKGVRVTWQDYTEVVYTDSISREAPEVLVTVFETDGSTDIDLTEASFIAITDGTGDDTQSGTCSIDASLIDGATTCVTSCTNSATEVIYLESDSMTQLKNEGRLVYSALVSSSQNSLDVTGLTVGNTYAAFVQFKRGSSKSLCKSVVARENKTLTELNGEDDAELKNPNCFIATAAFGSPLSHKVDTFRWFRNHYLLTNEYGKHLVNLYYKYSPPIAEAIRDNKYLKYASLTALYPAYWAISLLQSSGYLGALLLTLLLLISIKHRSLIHAIRERIR